MKILVLAAHPDDEVLGVGGTIKKFTKNKDHVKIVIFATGILARRSSSYNNNTKYKIDEKTSTLTKKQITKLQKNAKDAAKILGVSDIEFLDLPDNEMDKLTNLEIVKEIEKIIEIFNPSIIFTHSNSDINIDHRILYNATITATRPTPNNKVAKIYAFETPSSTEWNFPNTFSPNYFVDISKELVSKITAMEKYVDEIREFPHPRSFETLEIIAKRWGTVCGFHAAEAFQLVRELKK